MVKGSVWLHTENVDRPICLKGERVLQRNSVDRYRKNESPIRTQPSRFPKHLLGLCCETQKTLLSGRLGKGGGVYVQSLPATSGFVGRRCPKPENRRFIAAAPVIHNSRGETTGLRGFNEGRITCLTGCKPNLRFRPFPEDVISSHRWFWTRSQNCEHIVSGS